MEAGVGFYVGAVAGARDPVLLKEFHDEDDGGWTVEILMDWVSRSSARFCVDKKDGQVLGRTAVRSLLQCSWLWRSSRYWHGSSGIVPNPNVHSPSARASASASGLFVRQMCLLMTLKEPLLDIHTDR
jgi:hypothetical protein